jgi:hypothetical protein
MKTFKSWLSRLPISDIEKLGYLLIVIVIACCLIFLVFFFG